MLRMDMFLRKKKYLPQLDLSLDEQFLFFDARDFLRSLITGNTHRIQKFFNNKWIMLGNGRIDYLQCGGKSSFKMMHGRPCCK